MNVADSVLAQLAALKGAPAADLRAKWRQLFDTEPPRYNRSFLESRLAYRIQELAYGGLSPATVERLQNLGDQFDSSAPGARRRARAKERPVAGTRLIREWQGVEYTVTVTRDAYEWQGRPYKSLTSVARAITGSAWNGWVFFGLKSQVPR